MAAQQLVIRAGVGFLYPAYKSLHAIMSEGSDAPLSEELRARFSPRYDEWRSLLHSGFSLLLHGHAAASAPASASGLSLRPQPQPQPQPPPPLGPNP